MKDDLQIKLQSIPQQPGVYQFYDKDGKILYVGKAKNLKKRVASYFQKKHDYGKTTVLVKKICDVKYILVDTELDALLLENSLIKKHQPRYNVMLKDDKTYPWICIKNERFPRVIKTRRLIRDKSEYFGPYPSGKMLHTLLDLFKENYTLRTCNFNLSKENVEKGKFKVCLEYHIGNCKGPCEGKQKEEDYLAEIEEIRDIIKGNITSVIRNLKEKMKLHAEKLAFEKAQEFKEKIDVLENYQSKSTVVNPKIHNVDVYSFIDDVTSVFINYLRILNGAIIQSNTIELKRKLNESKEELLSIGISEMRQRFQSNAKENIVPFLPDFESEELSFTVPKRGDKKSLLDLSERNAKYFKLDKQKQEKIKDPERHSNRILEQLKTDLRLKELPKHIECFDNSNIQGTNPVAACVVFKNAKPAKKEYRHFNIKSVEGPDDFASMEEVVYRRYSRLLEEGLDLPQLIVIDGGKGQLNAAIKSLEKLGLIGKVAIVGIAKKLEEIYFPGDPYPLHIDKRSESLKVIQHARNEAHRFGITHHRNKRSKGAFKSELDGIKGIGPKAKADLLKTFKTISNIKSASEEELSKIVGTSKSKLLKNYFSS